MKLILVLISLLFLQDEIPFKPKEEFDIKLNFEFRKRPAEDPNKFTYVDNPQDVQKKNNGAPLPYLFMQINTLALKEDEVRVRVSTNENKTIVNKKLDKDKNIKLELGFTDDIKDRVKPYEFTVFFLSDEKKQLSKIEIFFDKDGTYLVNGEKRGKL